MGHFRLPTKSVTIATRVDRYKPPRGRSKPSTADLALMRAVLGLPPDTQIHIATHAGRP